MTTLSDQTASEVFWGLVKLSQERAVKGATMIRLAVLTGPERSSRLARNITVEAMMV